MRWKERNFEKLNSSFFFSQLCSIGVGHCIPKNPFTMGYQFRVNQKRNLREIWEVRIKQKPLLSKGCHGQISSWMGTEAPSLFSVCSASLLHCWPCWWQQPRPPPSTSLWSHSSGFHSPLLRVPVVVSFLLPCMLVFSDSSASSDVSTLRFFCKLWLRQTA